MAAPDFLIHEPKDNVGVVVVEGVQPGKSMTGWYLSGADPITLKALDAIPLGHKVALAGLKAGDTMMKYGHDCGELVAAVKKGGHVHVHNAKTKRW